MTVTRLKIPDKNETTFKFIEETEVRRHSVCRCGRRFMVHRDTAVQDSISNVTRCVHENVDAISCIISRTVARSGIEITVMRTCKSPRA